MKETKELSTGKDFFDLLLMLKKREIDDQSTPTRYRKIYRSKKADWKTLRS